MIRVLLVGIGGFLGSILRYGLATAVQGALPPGALPLGTLLVNLLGCFGIGLLSGISEERGLLGPDARALLAVGLLGGFTTFSAFANETLTAWRDGAPLVAVANVSLGVGACLLAAWAGRALVA